MKTGRALSSLFGIGLAMATGCAAAQTTANGPYYATPSWDQTIPSSSRFVVLSNLNSQAVLDRETGLVWELAPQSTSYDYYNAFFGCSTKAVGGRFGWRLPSYVELMSLLEVNNDFSRFAIPAGHPFVLGSSGSFWSTTAAPIDGKYYFTVSYNPYGKGVGVNLNTSTAMGWCVRGSDR